MGRSGEGERTVVERILSTTTSSLSTLDGVVEGQVDGLRGSGVFSTSAGTITLHPTPSIIQIIFARLDVLVYPLGDFEKGPFDSFTTLGAGLDVFHHSLPLAPVFGFLSRDGTLPPPVHVGTLAGQVGLVAHQDDDNALFGDLS